MERIGFRIYDPENEIFHFSGSTPSMLASFFSMTSTLNTLHGIEYQQLTNLRDSNGTEIYEGDIIRHRIKNIRTVVFKDGAFRTKRINYVAGELTDAFFFYEDTGRDWEIIGNVFEDGELLKGGTPE